MRVKRLKMQSFRGIGDLTLDFDDVEPTVFVGINGVGKSSILDCIAIFLSQIIGNIVNPGRITLVRRDTSKVAFESGNNEANNQFTTKNPDIKKRYFNQNDIKNSKEDTENELDIVLISDILKLRMSKSNIVIKGQRKFRDKSRNFKKTTDSIYFQWKNNKNFNLPIAVYYTVNRAVLDIDINLEIIDVTLLKQIDAYDQALNGVRINFKNFFQWFRSLEDLENEKRLDKSEYLDNQLQAVRKAIYLLISEFSSLRVRRSPLRMTVQKNDEELNINQLSDGEKCLLAMVGDLARRLAIANPGLEDPLAGTGVVLIDEIELHLHPNWQRKIIPALTRTFPNCQFIITTHSPQVISHVKPQGIYMLKKADSGVIAQRPESSYGRDSNQILEDIMDDTERPLEIKDRLHELFQHIEKGNLDDARRLSQEIADNMGESDPALVKARVSIRRKEILNR